MGEVQIHQGDREAAVEGHDVADVYRSIDGFQGAVSNGPNEVFAGGLPPAGRFMPPVSEHVPHGEAEGVITMYWGFCVQPEEALQPTRDGQLTQGRRESAGEGRRPQKGVVFHLDKAVSRSHEGKHGGHQLRSQPAPGPQG